MLPSDLTELGTAAAPTTAKILIAGGLGVGKTTLVGAVTESQPLQTEEELSDRAFGADDTSAVGGNTTAMVATDFGRITLRDDLALYLFGMPGQERFRSMWDELSHGSVGAVVLADTRCLEDSLASLAYFERRGIPSVVAVNCFDHAERHDVDDVRMVLDLDQRVPVLLCDARKRASAKAVLITLVSHVLSTRDAHDSPAGALSPAPLPSGS